jgi:hypothetical protein
LIGHSLGADVISEAAVRLLSHGYRVEQLTYLDAVSSFNIGTFYWSNQPARAWSGVPWVDNYWGNGQFGYPFKHFTVGPIRPRDHAFNLGPFEQLDHIGVHEAYFRSVQGNYLDAGGQKYGWYFSPLGPGQGEALLGVNPATGQQPPTPETVFNGAFTISDSSSLSRNGNLPGYEWSDNGQIIDGTLNGVIIERLGHTNKFAAHLYALLPPYPSLRHAPLWVPSNASAIRFDAEFDKTYKNSADHFDVYFDGTFVCSTTASMTCTTARCDITAFRSRTGVLEFRLVPDKGHFTYFTGWIDNIALELQ